MRASLMDARVDVAVADVAALHASLDPGTAAFEAARVLMRTSGADAAAVWVVADGDASALCGAVEVGGRAHPVRRFEGRTVSRSSLEASISTVGIVETGDPALTPSGDGAPLLVPLPSGDDVVAVAALHRPAPGSDPALESVAPHAGAALANALAFARVRGRAERLGVLDDLGGAITERAGAQALVERLNLLLADRALEVEGLAWKSRSVARRVGGSELTARERAMVRESESVTTLPDGRLAVAMRAGGKHVGAMRVRGPVDETDVPFLELLAAAVAEVGNRMARRAEVEDAARATALAHERDRIAGDLHDTAGQLFVAIQLLARREAEKLGPGSEAAGRFERLADLAEQGKWEIDSTVDALASFPAERDGLVAAVRSLASSFHADSELDVIVDVCGRPARLGPRAERALYRVVHESLANAWRHARCSVVRVALSFERHHVRLGVLDDGTGLTETIPDRGRVGTSNMRRAITEVGGTFRIRNAQPRGVVVEAEVPRDGR